MWKNTNQSKHVATVKEVKEVNSDIKEFINQVVDKFAFLLATMETTVFIFQCMISQFDVKKLDAADL